MVRDWHAGIQPNHIIKFGPWNTQVECFEDGVGAIVDRIDFDGWCVAATRIVASELPKGTFRFTFAGDNLAFQHDLCPPWQVKAGLFTSRDAIWLTLNRSRHLVFRLIVQQWCAGHGGDDWLTANRDRNWQIHTTLLGDAQMNRHIMHWHRMDTQVEMHDMAIHLRVAEERGVNL